MTFSLLKNAFDTAVTSQFPRKASAAKVVSVVVRWENPGTSAEPPGPDGALKFTRPFIPPTGAGLVFGRISLDSDSNSWKFVAWKFICFEMSFLTGQKWRRLNPGSKTFFLVRRYKQMSVLSRSFKQTNGYFVPVADARTRIYTYTPAGGAGGDFKVGAFLRAVWATAPVTVAAQAASTLVASAGAGLLKDMGKTVVSANRTFRKVQLVIPGLSTGGVSMIPGNVNDHLTSYIELAGPGGAAGGAVTPVAYLPGLMLIA